MTVDDFLSRLKNVRRCGSGWEATCPAHEDGKPSLSIGEGRDGRILLKCFAGCSAKEVVEALNLPMSALFADGGSGKVWGSGRWTREEADRALVLRGLRPETLTYFRVVADVGRQAWVYPLGHGRPMKYKAFESRPGGKKYWNERGTSLGCYHLEPCRGFSEAWLVEGEPDVWIAHQAGVPAFSLTGGAGNVNAACVAEILRAQIGTIHIVYDRDDRGRNGTQKVAQALAEAGQVVTLRELPAEVGFGGDVTVLYNNLGGDDEAFRSALTALPMVPLGANTASERNARIREAALETLRETQQVASWGWSVVDRLCGGIVAGWLYVVGARTSNGKTTLLLNLLSRLREDRVPTLYFGTEMAAEDLVKKWAALRLGLDELRVFENRLSEDERDALEREIVYLLDAEEVTFSTVTRLDLKRLASEIAWAFDARHGCAPRVIILDHLHRISQDREELEQLTQELKNIATERKVAMIVAAQLNREKDAGAFDLYTPPSLNRYKGSAAIEENADVALGLFRPLRPGMTMSQRRAVQHGECPVTDFAEPNTMGIVCLKHRYRGAAQGRFVSLVLRESRLESKSFAAAGAEPPVGAGDAWEPEESEGEPF
jgi:archaellum biogenesis ATPase FlaH